MTGSDVKLTLALDADAYYVNAQRLATSVEKLTARMGQIEPVSRRAETALRTSTRGFRDLVLVAGTLRFALLSVYDVFGRLPMHIMKNAGEIERLQQLMKGLSKEATDAGKALEGMRDFNFVTNMAKTAPFEISALSDSFVKLKVAGVDPTNGSLQTLVDSVARFGGSSDVLKRASVAISQMAGKGVVSMEELRQQLGEAIPTAMKAMADGLGMSMSELTKIVSTGTLQAMPAINAMMRELRIQNEGAAADMMGTWVGMNAQLKTEWMLTSKAIADSGFGDGMKGIVRDLTNLLRNDDFQEWARSFGAGMGDVIRTFRSLAGFIYENADALKIAALALAAWKIQGGLVNGIAANMRKRFDDMRISATQYADTSKRAAHDATSQLRVEAAAYAQRAAAEKANATERIKQLRTENATVNQLQNQRIAEYSKMVDTISTYDRKYQELQRRIESGEASKQQTRQVGKYAAMAKEMDQMRMSANNLSRTIGEQMQVMNTNDRTVVELNRSIEANTRATHAAAAGFIAKQRAVQAATIAVRGFNTVIGALGGYIGVAITAITMLVSYWLNVRNAANEAAEAQARAANKTTIKGDTDTLQKQIDERRAELNRLESPVASETRGRSGVMVKTMKSKEQLAADATEFKKKSAELKTLVEDYNIAKANMRDVEISTSVNGMERRYSTTVEEIKRGTRNEILAIEASAKAVIGAHKGTDKEKAEALKKFTDQRNIASAVGSEKLAEHWSGVEQGLIAQAKSASGGALREIESKIDRVRELREKAELSASQYREIIKPLRNVDPKAKDSTKGAKTPFANMTAALKADAEQLDEQLAMARTIGEKANLVDAAVSRMQSRFDAGKYEKGVTQKDIDAAAKMMRENASMKSEIKQTEEVAQAADKAADYIDGMLPKYKEALMVLADPLGTSGITSSNMAAVLEQLRTNTQGYEEQARRMGVTFDEVAATMRSEAATMDMAENMRKVVSQSVSLQGQLTNVTRTETAERLRIEFEAENSRQQMMVSTARAAGANEQDIRRMQSQIAHNQYLRQQELVEKTQHPLAALAADWDNLQDHIATGTVNWVGQMSDAFVQMATTGKASFSDLTKSILTDLARMYAQKGFSQLLQLGISAVSSMFPSNAAGGLSGANSTSSVSSTGAADYSLGSSTGSGLGLKADMFRFADGGIMTEFGSLPLRKYANGGIARSPQLALYGEGKHPEAYVPLPDGRTIPVTMQGGAGGAMVSNITINIDGKGNTSTSGGGNGALGDSFAKKLGTHVKTLVREEMMKQYRQGGTMAS